MSLSGLMLAQAMLYPAPSGPWITMDFPMAELYLMISSSLSLIITIIIIITYQSPWRGRLPSLKTADSPPRLIRPWRPDRSPTWRIEIKD